MTFKRLIKKYKLLVNILALVVGFCLMLPAFFKPKLDADIAPWKVTLCDVLPNIGSGIFATSLMALFLVAVLPTEESVEEIELRKWGIQRIYEEREKIRLSGNELPTNQLDFVAFGLKHFRSANDEKTLLKYLNQGLIIRIITLDPRSRFVAEQQLMENADGLQSDIEELRTWQEQLNGAVNKPPRGKIEIKYYDSLPLDFYCHAGKRVFVGPYVPGTTSGRIITYEFTEKSKGGKYYSKYFESLWSENRINFVDPDIPHLVGNQKNGVERALSVFCDYLAGDNNQAPIGVVVMFKKDMRRTIFSCNKMREEQHNCYAKNLGAVGSLINLNDLPKKGDKILFEDINNQLAFSAYHTDKGVSYCKEEYQKNEPHRLNDDATAILAIPIIDSDQLIGAITFDFIQLPEKYNSELKQLRELGKGSVKPEKLGKTLSDWFKLADSCRQIVQPMLGNEMELQYKHLYEEEWHT